MIRHVSGLEALSQLRMLDLSDNCLTALEGLPHLPELEHLKVSGNKLSSTKSVLPAMLCPELKMLDLSDNKIVDDAIVDALAAHGTLVWLRMVGNPVTSSVR